MKIHPFTSLCSGLLILGATSAVCALDLTDVLAGKFGSPINGAHAGDRAGREVLAAAALARWSPRRVRARE